MKQWEKALKDNLTASKFSSSGNLHRMWHNGSSYLKYDKNNGNWAFRRCHFKISYAIGKKKKRGKEVSKKIKLTQS